MMVLNAVKQCECKLPRAASKKVAFLSFHGTNLYRYSYGYLHFPNSEPSKIPVINNNMLFLISSLTLLLILRILPLQRTITSAEASSAAFLSFPSRTTSTLTQHHHSYRLTKKHSNFSSDCSSSHPKNSCSPTRRRITVRRGASVVRTMGNENHEDENGSSSKNINNNGNAPWSDTNVNDVQTVKSQLHVWPLDEYNLQLLNEVHPKHWPNERSSSSSKTSKTNEKNKEQNEHDDYDYDLIAIGAGAGGLVSSRQIARRGGRSAMISSNLAGGDCLNVGCVPSKALIRSARLIRELYNAHPKNNEEEGGRGGEQEEFGVTIQGSVKVDFAAIMKRMRKIRAEIAPIDGHERGKEIGVDVYQGFGRFVNEHTIEVLPVDNNKDKKSNGGGNNHKTEDTSKEQKPIQLTFQKVAICTGGRATIPTNIPGLSKAPYTTNETLFNLTKLPKRMIILGSGVVALEMAQTFATFGSDVTVLVRSHTLFPRGDPDAGPYLMNSLKKNRPNGVKFLTFAKITNVDTIREGKNLGEEEEELPLMKVSIEYKDDGNGNDEKEDVLRKHVDLECECLLVATGRTPNVENLNLEGANVEYDAAKGVIVDDNARSTTNPNVYSVGDCTADVPRLTHMAGEMAKLVVQNACFDDDWKLSSLVVPACMYTEPEFATVGYVSASVDDKDVDVYYTSLEHNDRSICDGDREGYAKIYCKKGTGTIIGCSIIGSRAGEIINEVTLAMKHGIPLEGIGRNIHCYPTTGESVMGCGIQLINSK